MFNTLFLYLSQQSQIFCKEYNLIKVYNKLLVIQAQL